MEENSKKTGVNKVEEVLSYGGMFLWDASSLACTGFKKCVQTLFPVIQKYKERFVVPSFVKSRLTEENGAPARMMLERGLFQELSEMDSYEAAFAYYSTLKKTKLNVFVNSNEARNEILKAGKAAGIFVYFYMLTDEGEIEAFKFSGEGKKEFFSGSENKKTWKEQRFKGEEKKPEPKKFEPRGFTIKSQPEKVAFAPIAVKGELKTGDYVTGTNGKAYRLETQEVNNNGAVTYSANVPGIWVKIFHSSALNTYTAAKIERMLTQPMNFEGLCWPLEIVRDEAGNFRGYTLKAFEGVPLHLCVFKRAGIDSYFPNWSKVDLCELAETMLKMIEFLHKKNVLFGCINPAAIRVVDKNKVYFTDTDNYQIDGFPAMVHNISFTAPELLDKKVYLATKANENFAIAELVFMLMMPGKTPYAVGSEEAPEQLIKKMEFPYSAGQFYNKNALPGMWRFMWSHLGSLRGAFYNVFQNGGKYNKPEERRDVFYWKNGVGYYKKDLLEAGDKESLKIYPKTFKRENGENFYRCNYCGVEHPKYYFYGKYFDDYRICNSCIDKKSEVSFTCKACGKTYYYTNRTALFHKMMKKQDSDWKDQKYCRDCKKKIVPCASCGKEVPYYYLKNGRCQECDQEYKNSTYKWVTCRDCGGSFEITRKDHEYYVNKGYSEPTRCQACREKKKNAANSNSGTNKIKNWFGW